MKYTGLLSVLLAVLLSACAESNTIENELQELDTLLDHREEWIAQRRNTIDQLVERYHKIANPEEKYWVAKAIFEEYLDFDSDSALIYARRNYDLARRIGNEHEQLYWQLEEAHVLTETGQLQESQRLLMQLRPQLQDSTLLTVYYGNLIQYHYFAASYGSENYYEGDNYNFRKEIEARDSLMQYMSPSHPTYLQMKVWQYYFDKSIDDNYRDALEDAVVRSDLSTQADGMNAFMLAQTYREEGDADRQLKYLIWSAKAYVKSGCVNHITTSFQELSQYLLGRGDLWRAYTYINFTANNLSQYDNRVQTFRVSQQQNVIKDRYLAYQKQQQNHLKLLSIVIGVLAVLFLIELYWLYRQVQKVRQKRRQLCAAYREMNQQLISNKAMQIELSEANRRLADLNEQLTAANDLLTESNFVKEEYIGYVFSICSSYIDKLNKFRKTISRKIKAGQVAELARYSPTNMDVQNDMKEFYQSFDAVFLRIYPSFVSDINGLMREGEQIVLPDENHLNTDLRILALMRLGISDCEKIADFLHCSVQSVYNSRRSVYSRLSIPMKDFKELVPKLGNASRLT